jgi:hypothetical protein
MKQQILQSFFDKNRAKTPQIPPLQQATGHWIQNLSLVPYLPLILDHVPYQDMLAEAAALDDLYVTHRSNDSAGWSSLSIHGISSQHTDHFAVYPEYSHLTNDTVPYNWTEIADRCPVTVSYFRDHFPHDVYHRVRFMRLDPDGYILPHSDSPDRGLRATNISLNNPDNCEFVFEGQGLVPYKNSGSAIMLANGYVHSIWNRSPDRRYHIIVHGYATRQADVWDQVLVKSYQALCPEVVSV